MSPLNKMKDSDIDILSADGAQDTQRLARNEAAERLRGGLEAIRDTSTDSASRQLAESLLALLETHDAAERHRAYAEGMDDGRLVEQAACREKVAAERRATVERIRAAVYKTDPTFQVTAGELYAILDKEAAR